MTPTPEERAKTFFDGIVPANRRAYEASVAELIRDAEDAALERAALEAEKQCVGDFDHDFEPCAKDSAEAIRALKSGAKPR